MTCRRPVDFSLYLITDRRQAKGEGFLESVVKALRGGVKALQLREKDLSARQLLEMALGLREITSRYGARLFINDRIDIALAVDADGVHLGESSIPASVARRVIGEEKLIGVSCHDRAAAMRAQHEGADFITFGPVFYTPSKAPYGDPVGLGELEAATHSLDIPVFGLGGINRHNSRQVIQAGASGIALISAILAAEDPCMETQLMLSQLGRHKN